MKQHTNFSLLKYNTFNIDINAQTFVEFDSPKEIKDWIIGERMREPVLVVGGGSNLLFTSDFKGTVLYPAFKGKAIVEDNDQFCLVYFAAGEEWDDCVAWAVENDLWGIENLSYIPGHAGAAPVQNIGAYGVELAELVESVEGIYLESGEGFIKNKKECDYDYRYSIFKGPLKHKTVVTGLTLRLKKKPDPRLNYGGLKEEVDMMGEVDLRNIRQAVINIRMRKLPDPKEKGNGGSFFKNPVIDSFDYKALQNKWPEIPGYFLQHQKRVKVPAGWLIEKAGWKGKKIGRTGVHENQALVLVNNGGATGFEIAELAKKIQNSIEQQFGICLEPEVNIF